MVEKLKQIYAVIGTLKVEGWENYEKLVYIKLLIDKLIKETEESNG